MAGEQGSGTEHSGPERHGPKPNGSLPFSSPPRRLSLHGTPPLQVKGWLLPMLGLTGLCVGLVPRYARP